MRNQISKMIQSVVDGEASAAEVHSLLKGLQYVIESGLKVISGEVLNEARDFNKGEVYYGGTWEVRGTPTYLDFTKDETYQVLFDKARDRKADLNAAYKAGLNGRGIFDEATGEQVPVIPVKTPSKEIAVFKSK